VCVRACVLAAGSLTGEPAMSSNARRAIVRSCPAERQRSTVRACSGVSFTKRVGMSRHGNTPVWYSMAPTRMHATSAHAGLWPRLERRRGRARARHTAQSSEIKMAFRLPCIGAGAAFWHNTKQG
jgi:hypothetical protein